METVITLGQTWGYLVTHIYGSPTEQTSKLEKLGKEKWELVSAQFSVKDIAFLSCVFKRPQKY